LQAVYPVLHAYVHPLFAHVAVACCTCVVHTVAHVPQWFASFAVSVHVAPQSVGVLAGHPDTHEYEAPDPAQSGVPAVQVTPHAPQLLVVSIGVSQPWSGPPMPQCV